MKYTSEMEDFETNLTKEEKGQLSDYEKAYQKCMNDPSISFLFKETLERFDKKNPVDALNDAELLVLAMKLKLGSVIAGHRENL